MEAVDNVAAKMAAAKASAVAVLGQMAARKGRTAGYSGKMLLYMGKANNRGRYSWRVQGNVLAGETTAGLKAELVDKPIACTSMIVKMDSPYAGEWTAWVHFPVVVHHMTVRKMFKRMGCFLVAGCNLGDFPNL